MSKPDYDAIIIGAGISGLVCGCYLAKAGMKTLIVEKNAYPGGYCCSFKRQGFHFDACVHALSSLKEGGLLSRILKELGVLEFMQFVRPNPTDSIITPKFHIDIFHNSVEMKEEFVRCFPKEKESLDNFFKYIMFSSFFELRSKTFDQFLDTYFHDEELKNIFSSLMLQLLGVTSDKLSATVACLLWKEFILDGGYYPSGGIQVLPDTLSRKFMAFGGRIMFAKRCEKISIGSLNMADGVILQDGQMLTAKYVISACDMRQTFFEFVGVEYLPNRITNAIRMRSVSSSGFLVYIGIDRSFDQLAKLKTNMYVIDAVSPGEIYNGLQNSYPKHFVITSSTSRLDISDTPSLCLATNASYREANFWTQERRFEFANKLVDLAERVFPRLRASISLIITAAPTSFYKWTGNYQGAGYGWASMVDQFGDPDFSQKACIENLYLTGHWSNQSSGVPFVANCGRIVAGMILLKYRRRG